MKTTTLNRQSLLDIAVQACGSLEAALAIAIRNDIPLTAELAAGGELEVAAEDVTKKQLVAALAAAGVQPATAITAAEVDVVTGGIEYMAIEIDFIVS